MATKVLLPETHTDPLIHRKISRTPINKDSIEAMTPESDYKVVGQFVNIEAPGVPQKFCGKYYRGMQYFCETLEDSKTYTIPYSVARYINERWSYEKHSYIKDEKGDPIKEGKTTPRGKFIIQEHLKK